MIKQSYDQITFENYNSIHKSNTQQIVNYSVYKLTKLIEIFIMFEYCIFQLFVELILMIFGEMTVKK